MQIAASLKQNHKKCMEGKFSARKRNKTQESDEETRDFAVNSEISNDMQERAVRLGSLASFVILPKTFCGI
jgi:hypothetical protein